MKRKLFVYLAAMGIAGGLALPAFALPPVHPVLPPVTYIDTETVTNVPGSSIARTGTCSA